MSVTQQIKDRLDIVQYIQEYVPDLKKAGRYYKACCPFHSENTPSFVVNPDTQSWRCFGACAEGGDIFTFVQKKNGWSFAEALRELSERAGVEVRQRSPADAARDDHLDKLRGLLETAATWYHDHLLSDDPEAERTLFYAIEQRGFEEKTLREWQIGYAPQGWQNMVDALTNIGYTLDDIVETGLASRNDSGRVYDRFRNRLMIPIRDSRGRVVGFGARALAADDNPKYLNSPQTPLFDKSHLLFGLDQAKQAIRESETAVIVEGYMDVIQAHQAGYTNVVAQMGTAMTEAQLALLAPRYASRVILALDADEAGQNAMRRSLEVAREALQADYVGKMSVDVRVLQIDDAKDPDDVLRETPEKWAGYVEAALPVAEFVINLETQGLSANASLQERQQIAQRVLPILTASENNLYTKDNLQKLALRLRISETDLLGWANEIQRIERAKAPRPSRSLPTPTPPNKSSAADTAPPYEGAPLLDEHHVSSSSEPPPLFHEGGDTAFDGLHVNVPPSPEPSVKAMPDLATRGQSRATEGYCVRVLLQDPATLALVNRQLRELAGDNQKLLNGPLRQLGAEDFGQGDYRALIDALLAALNQDETDLHEYLQHRLDDSLLDALAELLLEEPDELHQRVGKRMGGEFTDIWKQFERSVRPSINFQEDAVRRALQVRHQRLEREQQELRFLVEDAQRSQDEAAAGTYFAQSMPTLRALLLIQQTLRQQAMNP